MAQPAAAASVSDIQLSPRPSPDEATHAAAASGDPLTSAVVGAELDGRAPAVPSQGNEAMDGNASAEAKQPELEIEQPIPVAFKDLEDDHTEQRERRQAQEAKQHLVAGRPNYKFLDLSAALEATNLEHPRRAVRHDAQGRVLQYSRYSLRHTELGSHGCTWLCCLCRCFACFGKAERRATKRCCGCGIDPVPSEFSEYGLGVGLYFKQIKFFAWVFFILTLINTPAGILFWFGNGLLAASVTPTSALALFTIGNLGEGEATCEQVSEGQAFTLACSPGAVLGRVEAYYGQPRGTCACPVVQTPAPDCGGVVSGSVCANIPGGSARDSYCHLETTREVRMPSGTYVPVGACCSDRLVEGRPDFTGLDINVTSGCDSATAQHVFAGVCLGKRRCSVTLSSARNYSWTPDSTLRTDCRLLSGTGSYNTTSGLCTDNLESGGGLESCPSRSNRRLTIVGTCFATQLSLFDGAVTFDKTLVSSIVSGLSLIASIVFLISVWYLRRAEQQDALTRVRLTAADFSIYLPTLPSGVPEDALLDDLKWHFTLLVRRLRIEKNLSTENVPLDREQMHDWERHPHGTIGASTAGGDKLASAAASAAAAAAAWPPGAADDDDSKAAAFHPPHHGGRGHRPSISSGVASNPVHLPVVADVNFGRAQGRLLRLLILRGMKLRHLEYALQKIRIRKAEYMETVEREIRGSASMQGQTSSGPAARTRAGALADGATQQQLVRAWLEYVNSSERIAALRLRARRLMAEIEKLNSFVDEEESKEEEAEKQRRETFTYGAAMDDDSAVLAERANEPASAFVTFTDTTDRALVLDAYTDSWLWRVCCRNRNLVLETARGNFPIRVRPAPAPSDVNFENQDVSACSRLMRQCLTLLFTLILLGLAAVALYFTEDTKRELQRLNPTRDCRVFTTEEVTNKTLAVQDEFWQFFNATTGNTGVLECYCRNVLTDNPTGIFSESFEVPTLDLSFVAPTDPAFADMQAAKARDEFYPGVPLTTTSRNLCTDWFNTFLAVQSLVYGSAAITLAVNILVRGIISRLVAFERLGSKTDETASRALKLFLLQFLNTGALVLILNAHIETDFTVLRRGAHRDFDADWYLSVGVSITIVMIANIFIPHLTPLVFSLDRSIRRCYDRRCTCKREYTRALTQEQLVERLRGPPFLISERMAQVYTTVFVCLVYSTGIPLLLAVCTISMLCFWAVDFYLFVRVYRKPAPIDGSLAALFSSLLPFAAIIQLGLSMWMLTNEDIFPPFDALETAATLTASLGAGANEVEAVFGAISAFQSLVAQYDPTGSLQVGTRITRGHVLPLLALFLITLLSILLGRIVFRLLGSFLSNLFCCRKLGCCMSTSDLMTARAVSAERRKSIQRQQDDDARHRAGGVDLAGDFDGDDGSDVTSVDGESVVSSFDGLSVGGDDDDEDEDEDGGGDEGGSRSSFCCCCCCCCCCGKKASQDELDEEARRRRRRLRKKRAQRRAQERRAGLLDKESLLYRLERGEVPNYWQAIPTHILEQWKRGEREVKPEMRALYAHALEQRTADIKQRDDAINVVLELVRQARALKTVFSEVNDRYKEAAKQARERREKARAEQAAREEREAEVAESLKLMLDMRTRLGKLEERAADARARKTEAARAIARLERLRTKNESKIDELTSELAELGHEGTVEEAEEILETIPEPDEPDAPRPEPSSIVQARRELDAASTSADALTRDIPNLEQELRTATTALRDARTSKKGKASKAAAAADDDDDDDDDDEEEEDDKDADKDSSAVDAAREAVTSAKKRLEDAKQRLEATQKARDAARAKLDKLKAAKAAWAQYEEESRERKLAEKVLTLNRIEKTTASKLVKARTAEDKAEKDQEKLKEPLERARESASDAHRVYLETLAANEAKAREAKQEDEANNYAVTRERAEAMGDVSADLMDEIVDVEDDDDDDDDEEARDAFDSSAAAGPIVGRAIRGQVRPLAARSVHSMGLGSVHSFAPGLMTPEDLSHLSVPELLAHRENLAGTYKRLLRRAWAAYNDAKLGVGLQINVYGAQYLSGVHSYALTDAQSYRSKLGLDLKVPSWLLLGADQFGGVVKDAEEDEDLDAQANADATAAEGQRLAMRQHIVSDSSGAATPAAAAAASHPRSQ